MCIREHALITIYLPNAFALENGSADYKMHILTGYCKLRPPSNAGAEVRFSDSQNQFCCLLEPGIWADTGKHNSIHSRPSDLHIALTSFGGQKPLIRDCGIDFRLYNLNIPG